MLLFILDSLLRKDTISSKREKKHILLQRVVECWNIVKYWWRTVLSTPSTLHIWRHDFYWSKEGDMSSHKLSWACVRSHKLLWNSHGSHMDSQGFIEKNKDSYSLSKTLIGAIKELTYQGSAKSSKSNIIGIQSPWTTQLWGSLVLHLRMTKILYPPKADMFSTDEQNSMQFR